MQEIHSNIRGLSRKFCAPWGSLESDDFEQEIWLAILEGRVELDEYQRPKVLKALIKDCKHAQLHRRLQNYFVFDEIKHTPEPELDEDD